MYIRPNFKTKKALKDAVKAGQRVTIFQPNQMFPSPQTAPNYTGVAYVEGPHYPLPHKWYAEVGLDNGVIVEVK